MLEFIWPVAVVRVPILDWMCVGTYLSNSTVKKVMYVQIFLVVRVVACSVHREQEHE